MNTAPEIDYKGQAKQLENALNKHDGKFRVKLHNSGNPDFGQHPGKPLYETTVGWAEADTIAECRDLCRTYISFYDLGGGNWDGGLIQDKSAPHKSKIVARVSYNGRVWEAKNAKFDINAKEIEV